MSEIDAKLVEKAAQAIEGHHFIEHMPKIGEHLDLSFSAARHIAQEVIAALLADSAGAIAKHEQELRAEAWDESAHATTQFWTRMVGWANQADPRRENAPEQPENPYRADALTEGQAD
jgi:hypothetical protein